jgi:hypothetical protein
MAQPKLIKTGTGSMSRPGRIVGNADGTVPLSSIQQLNRYLQNVADKFNVSGISFGDSTRFSKAGNLDAQRIEVKFTSSGDEREIYHSLRRTPVGYIVVQQDKPGSLYVSKFGSWKSDRIFLKTDATGDSIWAFLLF